MLALTAAQIEGLSSYAALLRRWNRVYNLTAIDAAEQVLSHHLLDSLAIVRPLQAVAGRIGRPDPRVLDVGSGAGLPGLPLAIACPQVDITLIDAVGKKCAFLTQVVVELRLSNVTVRHGRVERLAGEFDLIASRAFAAATDLVRLTRHLLAPGGRWLAMKGHVDPVETAALPAGVRVEDVLSLAVPGLAGQRHLLILKVE